MPKNDFETMKAMFSRANIRYEASWLPSGDYGGTISAWDSKGSGEVDLYFNQDGMLLSMLSRSSNELIVAAWLEYASHRRRDTENDHWEPVELNRREWWLK